MKTVKKPISNRRLLLWIIFAAVWCAFGVASVSETLDMELVKRTEDHYNGIKHGGGDDACIFVGVMAMGALIIFPIYGLISVWFILPWCSWRSRVLGLISLPISVWLVVMWWRYNESFNA